jgi:oligopeptide/dipeptide ABC transporter ATP-binding protein
VFDYQAPYTLTFRGYDLLAVTTLTNGDGATISGSEYVLRSANQYPKWRIELKANGTSTFTWDDTWHEAISVAGVWGYVPNYAAFWTDTGYDIPVGNITSSSTSFTLAATSALEVGMYIKVDSEVMQITELTSTAVTHTRAELGTTAAAHTAGAAITRANVLADIMFAVRELVVYQYLAKDRAGGRVTVMAGGPELLIADEPTTALDVTVQREILDLLDSLRRDLGMALLLVTHNIGLLSERTDRLGIMYAGELVEVGPTRTVLSDPRHPYTQGLLKSLPRLTKTADRLPALPGQPPDLGRLPAGCPFRPRCPGAFDRCEKESPVLRPVQGAADRAARPAAPSGMTP